MQCGMKREDDPRHDDVVRDRRNALEAKQPISFRVYY